MKQLFLVSSIFFSSVLGFSQVQTISGNSSDTIDYSNPKEYLIAGLIVEGAPNLDNNLIMSVSGLATGQKIRIPGDAISEAIMNLWKQGIFGDVQIVADKIMGDKIFLRILVLELPRLSRFTFKRGTVSKSEADDIRDKIAINRGKPLNEATYQFVKNQIKDFYIEKGYIDTKVELITQTDTAAPNSIILTIDVQKGPKVKIGEITFVGATEFKKGKLFRTMKETKRKRWWNVFNSGKFYENEFEKDKQFIVDKYYGKGYRDAKVVRDSIYRISPNRIGIYVFVNEGKKYYFRNISFVGNSIFKTKDLMQNLGIKKGDVYNQELLDSRLYMSANGSDVSSLYLDKGYLFFSLQPVEVLVENDSIDLEIRIYEGKQATVNKVTVIGNTKTNDKVIMREVRTKPGQLFSRSDIIRTQRELSILGYFDAEKMQVNPKPNPLTGTVDIEYVVEERPNDQLELSGGFGGGRVVGTLGLSFNNFSMQNMFRKGTWTPLPSGDGQRLSLRAQSTGLFFQSYNFSFTEPWLGGKKPNSLSVNFFYSAQSNGKTRRIKNSNGVKVPNTERRGVDIWGATIGLGKRLKKPDDYFSIFGDVTYNYYVLDNYGQTFIFADGFANNLNFNFVISRNSLDAFETDYVTNGSKITLSTGITPPWSRLSGKDLRDATDQEKYKWIEYYKFKFTTSFFRPLVGKGKKSLVANLRMGYGLLGYYNPQIGTSPFERFYLGGSGLSGFALDGREIIALRGYDDNSVFTSDVFNNRGMATIAKYTFELHYPLSLNPQAMIYALTFAEAGNSWPSLKEFKPFNVKRSAGVGVRVFLPMFGLLGLDYGWPFDNDMFIKSSPKGQFHFTIGMNLGEL
jgi:outer membrane protein insertion porin family